MALTIPDDRFNQQVAAYWSWVAKREELGYWNMPGWQTHQNLLASGSGEISWIDVLKQQESFNSKGHALSLGCGSGAWERLLMDNKMCATAEGCDISKALVDQSQQTAVSKGLPLRYFVADLNKPVFSPHSYDIVIAAGILHHIVNLEGLMEAIKQALKPGGKLLVYDYVGPSRFQWDVPTMARCNYWLTQIPAKYRVKRGYPWYYYIGKRLFDLLPESFAQGAEWISKKYGPERLAAQVARIRRARLVLDEIIPPAPEQFLVTDPSEAVRSQEIMPIIKQHFKTGKMIPQGGTLTMPLFSRTVENYLNDPKGEEIVHRIYADERSQIVSGKLPSYLVAFTATA